MKKTSMTRRTFLQYACAAGVAAGASASLPIASFAAGPAQGAVQETRLLMGTIVTLTAYNVSKDHAATGMAAAFAEMERLIGIFDRHTENSALGQLNSAGRLTKAPKELVDVLARASSIHAASDAFFNPAIAPVVALLENHQNPQGKMDIPQSDMQHALALADMNAVSQSGNNLALTRSGMALSLDGIAKGYIADQASRVLARESITDHMVNAGGDIRTSGFRANAPWQLGIENPARKNTAVVTVALSGQALATSAGYARPYSADGTRHHLVNPFTGESPSIISASVIAKDAVTADALATAMALLPPHQGVALAKAHGAECLIFGKLEQRYTTPGWKNLEA